MLSKRIAYLRDYAEGALRRRGQTKRTDRFSTGLLPLDAYLGGGFGRQEGWEVVLLFGPTKIGKSFLALNFVRRAIEAGDRVGLLVLEDDGEDCYNRLEDMLGDRALLGGDNIYFTPEENLDKPWKLVELVDDIERWFVEEKLDLILLDHLQFAFENAESVRSQVEWTNQRVFMRNLSQMMKRISKTSSKTLILVSHTNKDEKARGVGKVAGSGGIAAAATKIIGIDRASAPRTLEVNLYGSRHTEPRDHPIMLKFDEQSRIALLHERKVEL